jgi:hypothetical protein
MRNSNTGVFEVYDISNNAVTSAGCWPRSSAPPDMSTPPTGLKSPHKVVAGRGAQRPAQCHPQLLGRIGTFGLAARLLKSPKPATVQTGHLPRWRAPAGRVKAALPERGG